MSKIPKNPRSYILHHKSGFTLIELLVVIVIIAILATLLTVNFIGVRQRGRDAKRKSDLKQIQTALELYRSDNGLYPATVVFPTCGNVFFAGSTTYMQKIPCDPLGSQATYNGGNFYYSSDEITYTLGACIENANDSDANISSTSPGGSGSCPSTKYYVSSNP